jgi:hypothetical protein
MIHPKTGHDCRKTLPDRWGPVAREVTIKISECIGPVEDPQVWWAHVLPIGHTCGEGKDCLIACGWLTHGDSPANAVYMAYDLMSTYWEECKADDEGGIPHCWCIDTVKSFPWEDPPEHRRYVKCCRCEHAAHHLEFEDAPQV